MQNMQMFITSKNNMMKNNNFTPTWEQNSNRHQGTQLLPVQIL